MSTGVKRWMWDQLTSPELDRRVADQPVIVLSIGSVEDHGGHLPMDVDNLESRSLCEAVGEQIPEEMLLLPHFPYGFETHHMDYPGTIDVKAEHLLEVIADIGLSVAHHGFRRLLICNGHGSNMPVLDLAARRINTNSEALCASFIWPNLILNQIKAERESVYPGGIAHAGELETSVYLHLNGDAVQMEQAQKNFHFPESSFFYHDLNGMGPINMAPWHSMISDDGTVGDPTVASAEKGRRWFDAAVQSMIGLVREFRTWQALPRTDHHASSLATSTTEVYQPDRV